MTDGSLAPSARPPRQTTPSQRMAARLTQPVDFAWLAAFRVCFGTVMAVSMARFLAYGWVDNFFVNPRFHFKYWGFEWVDALPAAGMHALFWILLVSASGMALGFCHRLVSAVFVVGFGYVQLIDVTNYLNHYYLAWLLSMLLAVSPAAQRWSVDAVLRRRRAEPGPPLESVSAAWLLLFRVQVGVVYVYAGLAKAHADWLLDAQPLRIWLGSLTDLPVLGHLFTWDGVPLLMSWAGFLFDTTVVGFLLWSRTRWLAYSCVIVFHAMTRSLFPIGMFSSIMVVSALVFFPADWPRGLARRLPKSWFGSLRAWRDRIILSNGAPVHITAARVALVSDERRGGAHASLPARLRRLTWVVGIAYCVWQVAMPMRYLVYGGNVRWHEQGMRFSWRVMVREKNGSVTFHVRDPRSGRSFTVAPRAYLTRLQEREMSGQPDLILQLAHRIRDDYSRQLGGLVEVRAEALVSLNGRKSSPMVDPSVNLAAVEDGLARYVWVLPAPSVAPPHVRPV